MFKYTLNGTTAPLGTLKTGHSFVMTNFPDEANTYVIKDSNGKPIPKKPVNVDSVIREALNFIDTHCAESKSCNKYFLSLGQLTGILPISLRQILDEKNLHIYRLGGMEDSALPAGYAHAWGSAYAQIGLNRIQLTDSGNAASTLLHELAHVAGAPGRDQDPKSLAAENALLYCFSKKLSKEFYNKDAFGMLTNTKGSRQGLA